MAFRDRFTAERLFYGAREVPGVGAVELAWVPHAAPSSGGGLPASPTTPGAAGKGDADGDAAMGDGAADGGAGRPGAGGKADEAREVEYDVAEDDDGWI